MDIGRKIAAEFLGTFWLVLGGCGSAVLAAAFPHVGIGLLGVAFAFGLTVLTGAYTFGSISGGHFNPAVTLGLWAGGRFPLQDIAPYWAAQVLGAISGAGVLYILAVGSVRGFAYFLGISTAIDLLLAYCFMHPLVTLLARRPALVRLPGIGIASGLDVASETNL